MVQRVRVVFSAVVGVAVTLGMVARGSEQSGMVPPTLMVELHCEDTDPNSATLAVTLRNTDVSDTTVVLGIALANGGVYLPTALKLRVRRSGSLREEELPYANPKHRFVSGRIDDWAVPLPTGSAFAVSIPVRHFITATSYTTDHKRFDGAGQRVDVRVALDARPIQFIQFGLADLKLLRLWVGTLLSNPVHIPNTCV
jgi:hypothetical protein